MPGLPGAGALVFRFSVVRFIVVEFLVVGFVVAGFVVAGVTVVGSLLKIRPKKNEVIYHQYR